MQISEINIYPIKSLKGISLNEAIVEDRGLRHDRRWMLIDTNKRFLTQREVPAMARVALESSENGFVARVGNESLEVPFSPATEEYCSAKIWSSSVRSEIYPDDVNDWFSKAIGTECRLVAMPEGAHRAVS